MASILGHVSKLTLGYLTRGRSGIEERAAALHDAADERPGNRFGKREALYVPQTPFPPTLWRPQCGRCQFWLEGEPGEPGGCHIVGREGDRWGGEAVHYHGWCGYFTPPADEPAFGWVAERLHPTGKESVRGQWDPEGTVKARQRAEATAEGSDSGRASAENQGGDHADTPADDGADAV